MPWVAFLPIILVLAGLAVLVVGAVVLVVMLLRGQRRQARETGYPSLGAYLRAAPRTDAEKRDAPIAGLTSTWDPANASYGQQPRQSPL